MGTILKGDLSQGDWMNEHIFHTFPPDGYFYSKKISV